MQIKTFLYQIKDERKEIQELTNRIIELESSLYPSGIRYDTDKVQTSPSDHMMETVAKVSEVEEKIKARKERLLTRQAKAESIIATLEDTRERQVLDLYFLSENARITLGEVADLIGYSQRETVRIYVSALDKLSLFGTDL